MTRAGYYTWVATYSGDDNNRRPPTRAAGRGDVMTSTRQSRTSRRRHSRARSRWGTADVPVGLGHAERGDRERDGQHLVLAVRPVRQRPRRRFLRRGQAGRHGRLGRELRRERRPTCRSRSGDRGRATTPGSRTYDSVTTTTSMRRTRCGQGTETTLVNPAEPIIETAGPADARSRCRRDGELLRTRRRLGWHQRHRGQRHVLRAVRPVRQAPARTAAPREAGRRVEPVPRWPATGPTSRPDGVGVRRPGWLHLDGHVRR